MALPDLKNLPQLANCIRALAMDAVEAANSGHPGMPMGMADVATVLYARHLKFYAHNPHWADRDRMILSGGHGSMLLYALSYLTGYEAMTLDEIKRFRKVGSRTPGHPEHDVAIGAEMTTGPLGQGIGSAIGFALAEKLQRDRFGGDLVNHRTYVLCGDGDMQEGISHEACALAGHMKLNNLIMLYDDNGISIDGPTHLSFTEDVCARFNAYGWATRKVNGHDMDEVDAALVWAKTQDRPVLIACKTTIGFGAGQKAGTADCHGSPLGKDEIATARKNLNWPHDPFVIPDDLLQSWRAIGAVNRDTYTAWEARLAAADNTVRQTFINGQSGIDAHALNAATNAAIQKFTTEPTSIATRKASQIVLEHLIPALPNLIGGSADLTSSNLTKVAGHKESPYVYYGVREHGMAAIMNGLTLHGGLVPYGGTFLCFADYMRPSMRLAALMGAPVVYVMTHDSIGLGEDGPTHQPVEHLASLRAIPNMRVFRPADGIETAVAWQQALAHKTGPSVLALSRQNTRPIDMKNRGDAFQGAYIVHDDENPRVIICATGSEVDLALDTAAQLSGIPVRVVSVPSFELFRAQPDAYKRQILGHDLPHAPVRVGIEAAIRQGWDEIIGSDGLFFGMSTFGASGPAKDVYAYFGLTPDTIAQTILIRIGG